MSAGVSSFISHFAFARYCPNPEDFDLMVEPEEYRNFLDKMWEKYMQNQECDTRFALKDHLWKLYLYEKGLFNPNEIDNPNDLILDGCHCGITHITTLADGTVYACRRSETPVGKVPEQSFYDIFNSEEMDKYRQYDKFENCSKFIQRKFSSLMPDSLSSFFTSSSITDFPARLIPVKTFIKSVFIKGLILCMYILRFIILTFYQL